MAPWLDDTQALLLQGQTAGEPCDSGCHAEKAAVQPIEGHGCKPLLQRSLGRVFESKVDAEAIARSKAAAQCAGVQSG